MLVLAVAVLSAALDALVAGRLLLRGRGPLDTQRMLRAALGSTLFFLAKAAVLLAVLPGFSLFLLILLAYAYLAGTLPALGLAVLLVRRRREVRPLVVATAALALVGVPVAAWCSLVEPFRLQLEQVQVPLADARAGSTLLRIGVLADIQANAVGAYEREAVARVQALEPDLILIPGDLAQTWPRDPEAAVAEFRELLAPLEAPLGVWMVLGNSDDDEQVRRIVAGTRVRLLENETVELRHADRRITLCGIGMSFRDPRSRAAVARLEQAPGDDDVRILLSHFPDAFELQRPGSRIDLMVAGHTHGGQVRLPWIGPPIKLSSVPRRVAGGGLWELDGRRLYVSRGVGVERGWSPLLRFNCPPEVTLLVLGDAPGETALAAGSLHTGQGGLEGPP